MTVDKLTRILPALGQPAQNSQTKNTEEQTSEASEATTASAEAVSIGGGFGVAQNSDADNRSKIEQLKKAVAGGTYKPSSYDVAEAVARELFA